MTISLNARAGAVALALGAGGGLALRIAAPSLAPLLLLCLAATCFGAWAFADEMSVRRPLNRAGLVAFAFAALAKTMVLMGATAAPQFLVLYVFGLLLALLLWSVALLHRRGVAIGGAAGALGALASIALLIAGHVAGVGALVGMAALYDFNAGAPRADLPVVTIAEAMFLVWALFAAGLLWTGRIRASD
jgi:hypothetical protein